MAAAAPAQDETQAVLQHLLGKESGSAVPAVPAPPADDTQAVLEHLLGAGATPAAPAGGLPPQPEKWPGSAGGRMPVLSPVDPNQPYQPAPPGTPLPPPDKATIAAAGGLPPGGSAGTAPPLPADRLPPKLTAEPPASMMANTPAGFREKLGFIERDIAAPPPPSGALPVAPPVSYRAIPEEEALRAADRRLDTLPSAFHNPRYHAAEGGPLSNLRGAQVQATLALARQLPKLQGQWLQDDHALAAAWRELNDYRKQNEGLLSPAQVKQYERTATNLYAQMQKHDARGKQIGAYMQRAVPAVLGAVDHPLHTGINYPQEGPPHEDQGLSLFGMNPLGQTNEALQQVNQARALLMAKGEYPPPAPFPPGTKPAQYGRLIAEKNAVKNILTQLGNELTDAGVLRTWGAPKGEPPQVGALGQPDAAITPGMAREMARRLTPWQKSLIPTVRAQLKAEGKAREEAGVPGALARDLATFGVAAAAGGPAGEAVGGLASRLLAPLEERLIGSGAGQIVGRFLLRQAPRLAAGAGGGAAAGGASSGVGTLLQGGSLPEAAKATGQGALQGAAVGSLFSAVHSGPAMWRAAKQELGSGWDPVRSPYSVVETAEAARRVYGLSPDETTALEQRLTRVAKAPAPMKQGLFRTLQQDMEKAKTPKVSAPTPPPETPTATESVPHEPRVSTPNGGSLSMRHMRPEVIEQHGAAAGAAGDTAGAASADALLAAHGAHEAHANAVVPHELASDYAKARVQPGQAGMTASRVMRGAATGFEKTDPDLAQKLHEGGDLAERGFRRNWLAEQSVEPAMPQSPPVLVSPWRRLTPEQQAKLPVNVRSAMLVQDASHSLESLAPGHQPVHSAVDLPGKPKTAAALEKLADQWDAQAGEAAARRVEPGVIVPPELALEQPQAATPPEPVKGQGPTELPTAVTTAPETPAGPPAARAGPKTAVANPTSFKTAQGSSYTVDEGGRTTRTKTPHRGHLPTDVGEKEPSDLTYYLSDADSQRAGMHGALSGRKTIQIAPDGKTGLLLSWNEKAGKWGITAADRQNPLRLEPAPAVGLHPLELWKKGETVRKWHAGNAITEITAGGAVQPAANSKPKIMPFAQEWAQGKAAPGGGETRAPHEMRQAEFVQQHGYGSGEELHVGMARVASGGVPGYHLELADRSGPIQERRVVVYRDQSGQPLGTLEFTVPLEERGDKRALILGLYVDPAVRRQGIATGLHQAMEKAGYISPPLADRLFSKEGATVYHARAVAKAVAEGQVVPPEVLADYPKYAAARAADVADLKEHPQAQALGATAEELAAAAQARQQEMATHEPGLFTEEAARPKSGGGRAAKAAAGTPSAGGAGGPAGAVEKPAGEVGATAQRPGKPAARAESGTGAGRRSEPGRQQPVDAETLTRLLDQAHGHVARVRDVNTLRESELRGYLDRVQAVFAETERNSQRAGERVVGEDYPRDWREAAAHLQRAREALDRGDRPGVLLAGEQALQTLHPLGYDPKESPLAGIAASLEKPSTLRARRGSIRIGPGGLREEQPAPEKAPVYEDPTLEKFLNENWGQAPLPPLRQSFRENLKGAFEKARGMLSDEVVGIRDNPANRPGLQKLRRLQKLPNIASLEAHFRLNDTLHDLTPEQFKQVSGAAIVRDLLEDVKHEVALPPGLTAEMLQAEKPLIEAKLAADPVAQAAYDAFRKDNREVGLAWRQSLIDIGQKPPELAREDWFHHEVRQEANRLAAGGGGATKLTANLKPTFSWEREGGAPFNTHLIEATQTVKARMIRLTEENKVIRFFQDPKNGYNIKPLLDARKAMAGDEAAQNWFRQMARGPGGEIQVRATPARISAMAQAGMLPDDPNGKFEGVIREIANNQAANEARPAGAEPIPLDPALTGALRDYAQQVLEWGTARPGRPAGELGEPPPTHRPYRFVEGNNLYRTTALSPSAARLAEAVAKGVTEHLTVGREDLRNVIAVGRRRGEMVLPNEWATALERLRPERPSAWDKLFKGVAGPIKTLAILNPEHLPTFFREKTLADATRIFRGNPDVFRELPQAARDLWALRTQKQAPSDLLRRWYFHEGARGLIGTMENAGSDPAIDLLRHLAAPGAQKAGLGQTLKGLARLGPDRLDELVRYASFRSFAKSIAEHGEPQAIGAARRDLALSLKEPDEQAHFLANHLMGAYDEIPASVRWIRDRFPFPYFGLLSAQSRSETNLFLNAVWREPRVYSSALRALGLENAANRNMSTVRTTNGLLFLTKLMTILGGAAAYNHLTHPKEEQQMDDPSPHLDLPLTMPGGGLAVWPRLGALPNAASLFGLDDPMAWGQMALNGHMTKAEIIKHLERSGPAEFMSLLGVGKMPVELAMGRRVATGNRIDDRLEYAAQQFHVPIMYEAARRLIGTVAPGSGVLPRPQRGGLAGQAAAALLGAQITDPGDMAYRDAAGRAREWVQQQKGISDAQRLEMQFTPLSGSLYYYKKALEYGDGDTALKYLAAYVNNGGDEKKLHQNLARMEPLYGLNRLQMGRYLKELGGEDRAQIRTAYRVWQNFAAPAAAAKAAELAREPDMQRYAEGMRRAVDERLVHETAVRAFLRSHPDVARKQRQDERTAKKAKEAWRSGMPALR